MITMYNVLVDCVVCFFENTFFHSTVILLHVLTVNTLLDWNTKNIQCMAFNLWHFPMEMYMQIKWTTHAQKKVNSNIISFYKNTHCLKKEKISNFIGLQNIIRRIMQILTCSKSIKFHWKFKNSYLRKKTQPIFEKKANCMVIKS